VDQQPPSCIGLLPLAPVLSGAAPAPYLVAAPPPHEELVGPFCWPVCWPLAPRFPVFRPMKYPIALYMREHVEIQREEDKNNEEADDSLKDGEKETGGAGICEEESDLDDEEIIGVVLKNANDLPDMRLVEEYTKLDKLKRFLNQEISFHKLSENANRGSNELFVNSTTAGKSQIKKTDNQVSVCKPLEINVESTEQIEEKMSEDEAIEGMIKTPSFSFGRATLKRRI
ncbi:hypothetical protein PFISCL1PPCAC_7669, partial [Pristionchus fissidentatus]